jgi:uncharacterized repeat protein (TIGR01451 family)
MRRGKIGLLRLGVTLVASCSVLVFAPVAGASVQAPGWEVFGSFNPTNLAPGGEGELRLFIYNTGAVPSSAGAVLTDTLPEGLEAQSTGGCSGTKTVTCTLGEVQPVAGPAEGQSAPSEIHIPVSVKDDVRQVPGLDDVVSVSGGGALGPARAKVPVVFSSSEAGLGFANADAWITNADGAVDRQAGSHPYELTMVFAPNVHDIPPYELPVGGETHALDVNLPPGLVGEPGAVPKCPREQFDAGSESGEGCPLDTEIGEDLAFVAGTPGHFKVFNLVPPPGVAAEFGFDFDGTRTFLDARVRSGGDYGITEHAIVPQNEVDFNSITIWGVPGEHGTGASLKPFLTLPTSCGAPPVFSVEMLGTWQNLNAFRETGFVWHNNLGEPVGITGCERLSHFEPAVSLAPDTSYSDSPAGLSATVRVPQGLNPEGLATSGLREASVVLPEGVSINPGQATGLAACTPAEENLPVGEEDGEKEAFDGPPSCPAASKVGTDEISTPLLPNRLKGNVYVLESNPPNVQLLVAASGEGVNIKLVGNVHLDEKTGQITTTFKGTPRYPGTPDAPVNEFVLSFNGGPQAALVTPATCGVYRSFADFTPWAAPSVLDSIVESNFQITGGPLGSGVGACTGPLPFTPSLTAGSTTDQAGGYTDFSMLLQRPDGQQRIQSLQFKAPEGLAGMIAKVSLCPEPQADAGTCSEASQIGHTVVGAGPGPDPLFVPEAGRPPAKIYLTGPYEGQPFGLAIVAPIIAGPFNLGTKVVRGSIAVDPSTAQITVSIDGSGPYAIPTILDGVPTDIRSIYAVIDKPNFMFNPTNCDAMSFTGTATSTEGTITPMSYPFEVGSCRSLGFRPGFRVSSSGVTSRSRGASLDVRLTYPVGELGVGQATSQANVARVRVELPKRLPSRLTTLQKACLAKVFEANPANCPAASVVGHASAVTPVLPVPLTGPAYFVSHGGEAFPSLILVLQGDNVRVDLVGTTFISKKGVTSSTFKQVPDVPVSSFELQLPEGQYSALSANGNLCKGALSLPTEFVGQNGALIKQSTKLNVTGCKKSKSKTKKSKGKKSKSGKKGKKKK